MYGIYANIGGIFTDPMGPYSNQSPACLVNIRFTEERQVNVWHETEI